ncbi:hypothetical protein CLV45_1910 [Hymenobacter chitinivorans DSM 11115]|uniref:Uncharacterized protein n=1 Tax=Hymenobacter chitinivorans DSM 11115 TaxID=1121954 RepID=A0A2M9BRF7_9BACT|nr:hypothetical protein CLV45_1910 [Hymenobacter chitinivorans DSM 11115]
MRIYRHEPLGLKEGSIEYVQRKIRRQLRNVHVQKMSK